MFFISVTDTYKNRARHGKFDAGAELRLGESAGKIFINSHNLAG